MLNHLLKHCGMAIIAVLTVFPGPASRLLAQSDSKPQQSGAEVGESEQPLPCKPVPRNGTRWWVDRHAAKLDAARQAGTVECDVLLLGDSITHSWEPHEGIWKELLPELSFFNIGFSGDRTEHVLWRLENGAVGNIRPKVVMLMIGTNNTGHRMDKPEEIAQGIRDIVSSLKVRLPETRVLVLGVFPRGEIADDSKRKNNEAINELICDIGDDDPQVEYLDIGKEFFSEGGQLTNGVRNDFLHLTADGYRIWARAVGGKLTEMATPATKESDEPDKGQDDKHEQAGG